MHKRSLPLREVGPKQRVIKLKFKDSSWFTITFHEIKLTRLNIRFDLVPVALFATPHRHSSALEPLDRFFKDADDRIGVFYQRAADMLFHRA